MKCIAKISAKISTVVLLVSACAADRAAPTSFNLQPEGGTISLAEGLITLTVPAGAVTSPTTVTATPVSGPADARAMPGLAFDLKPDGLAFAQPVTFKVTIPTALVPTGFDAKTARLFKVSGTNWTPVASTFNTADNSVSGTITGFSTYGLLGGNIGPAGATVSLATGVSLSVPAAAVTEPQLVSATASTTAPTDSRALTGMAFDLKPDGMTFAQPATLVLSVPAASLPAGFSASTARIFKANGTTWQAVTGSTYDAASTSASAPISSFSTFGVLGGNVGPAGGTVSMASGAVSVNVPAGALSEPQILTAVTATGFPSSPRFVTGTAWNIGPTGLTLGASAPLTLTYSPANIPAGVTRSSMGVHRVVSNAWVRESGGTHDSAQTRATAPVSSFSTFGLLADSAAAPPPPGATNEPANFQLISERHFLAKEENTWLDRGDAAFSIQDDATAPKSDKKVGQALFPAGFGAGSGPINTYINLPGNFKQLYMGVWLKFSANFEGHPNSGVNKIIFVWIDANANTFLNAQGQGSGTLIPAINLQNNVGGAVRLNPNTTPGATFTRGVWHFWEVLYVANTVGQLNGSIKWWLDGVEIGNYTNIGPARDNSNRWEIVSWNPTWGGAGGVVTSNMNQQIDYIRISGLP